MDEKDACAIRRAPHPHQPVLHENVSPRRRADLHSGQAANVEQGAPEPVPDTEAHVDDVAVVPRVLAYSPLQPDGADTLGQGTDRVAQSAATLTLARAKKFASPFCSGGAKIAPW